ncbi:MAG TPA: iron ABC transporter permease [Thermomicrobiales bacterium]|nr:iron ABC transporter permease [Thermomicrobiales bacterium]
MPAVPHIGQAKIVRETGPEPESRPRLRRDRLTWGRPRRPPVIVWLPALVISLGMLVPLVYLVIRAMDARTGLWPILFRVRTAEVMANTIFLAGSVAVGSASLAVPLAWLTTRTDLPGRRAWSVVVVLPLVIPSYVGAMTVVAALGPRGMLQGALEPLGVQRLPELYGFFGAWLTLTLFTYPYVYLGTRAALRGIDPAIEEAARSLGIGPWQTFFTCLLPQLRPAVVAGALLAALYAVSDFGVVTLLRFDVFTRVIYVQYRSSFDRSQAAAMALLLVLLALVVLVAESRARGRAAYYRIGGGASRHPRLVRLGRWRWLAGAYCLVVLGLALALPVGVLTYWLLHGVSGGEGLGGLGAATLHSIGISIVAAAAAVLAAMPVAWLAVRYAGRMARMLERLTYLGYALPGIVVALAFVFLGANYLTPLYQTLPLLVLAYVVRFLPQAVGSARAALLQVSPRLEEASRNLGRSTFGTAARITVPLSWPGIGAGAALVFLTVMKELPLTLLLRPTEWETLATTVWNASGGGAYGKAAAPALLLIVVAAVPTLLLDARWSPPRGEG